MDHIQDVYKKKPEMIERIWDCITKVNLKVDGKPFQVVYNDETDELEYRGRSGNETKVGPLIDDMYRLFSKPINDAIRHIEKRVDVFKRYKFLTFEVIDEILLLTAIIDKNGKFIDNPDDIDKIAKELDTDVMPCLWKGKLSNEQRDILMTAISTDIVPTKDEFVKWVKELFGTYDKFPKKLISRSNEFIEGIVFFYEVDGKVVEYKLVDPTFRQMVRDNHAGMKRDGEENAERYNEIYEIFLDWSEENATGLDVNRMRSIEFNFIEMMKDSKLYNKLMKLGTGLTTITTDAYFLQPDRISNELQRAIKKHGKVYQLLYEKFVRLFYKAKKRGFVVSKEFQQRVNLCVDKFANYSLDEDMIEIAGNLLFENSDSNAYNISHDNEQDAYNYYIENVASPKFKDNENDKLSEHINLAEKVFDLAYKYNQLTDFPFRFNSNSVKLARIFLKSPEFLDELTKLVCTGDNKVTENSSHFMIGGIKVEFGNGSVDKISTRNQEEGTCNVFNKYAPAINDNNISLDDIVDSLTYIEGDAEKQFSNDWKNSFYNQIKQIELVCKEFNIDITKYKAERRGFGVIGDLYYKFNLAYTKIVSEGDGKVDNYDPSDILIFKYSETENIKNILNNCISKLTDVETCMTVKQQFIQELVDKHILLPISLKKISGKRGEAGRVDKMNFDVNDKTNVESFAISDNTSDKQFKINCKGTFLLNHITSIENGNPEGKESFMQITLRSFGGYNGKTQVGIDVQHNGKEPSLGKCPKRYWVKKIFGDDVSSKYDESFDLNKSVNAFKNYVSGKPYNDKTICAALTGIIEMAMKLGPNCFPHILIH